MKAGAQPIADTVDEVLKLLRDRYGSNPGTWQKVEGDAERLFRYLRSVGAFNWEEITPEMVVAWCWTARKTIRGDYRRPVQSTARNRQWAALAVFEAAETLGLLTAGKRLIGEPIARPSDYVSTRPLTEEEAERVRAFADRGQVHSRRAVIVALALAGGTSTEIASVRKKDIDLDRGMVRIGQRLNPLCQWGWQELEAFLRIRTEIQKHQVLAVRPDLAPQRRPHAITVQLGTAIGDAGLRGRPGVSARSVRLYRAGRILRTLGLESATWFLGLDTLTTAADTLEHDWRTVGKTKIANHYRRGTGG
ncbi:MAG: hypothetical protein KTV45_16285 [Acidimicrobiia bacterium]|nr:hypothetical protein [Acidimicrobiia bacterium]